jgi:hypothetical protein
MPTLILEDCGLEHLEPEDNDSTVTRAGSDDRLPCKTSRSVNQYWFMNEEERRAYLDSLLSILG